MWRWLAFSLQRGDRCLRAVVPPGGDPYREPPIADLVERTAEPSTLREVMAAVRELRVRPRRSGFELVGSARDRVLAVRVDDPGRVGPQSVRCSADAPELRLDLALAVVAVFGALVVEVPFVGDVFVDGTRDRRALGEEAAHRLQQIGRRVARRAPFSFPLLVDLAQRLRGSP